MDAYLVRAACMQLNLQESCVVDVRQSTPVGARLTRIRKHDASSSGHSDAALRVPRDGQIDAAALCFHVAMYQRDVGLFHFATPKEFTELRVGRIVLCHQDNSRGVFVEPVNNAWTQRVPALR